jgi:hypothetical protein
MDLNEYSSTADQAGGDRSYATWTVPLLEPAQLLQAISGQAASALPLTNWAHELSDLHAAIVRFQLDRERQPSDCDCEQLRAQIDRIVGEIDAWAARNVPRMKNARKHTHSLGEVISHIATVYVEAWWTVMHSADIEIRHQAWFHLGEAREGYAEMVTEIRARHLQLPLGLNGTRRGRII